MKRNLYQIISVWQRLLLFVFPLVGMLLVSLFLLTEWAGPDAATAIVGEIIIRYRYVVLMLVLLLGVGHLTSLFRCAVLPLARITQSEARVRALLESIPDVFILMHRDGTYLDAHAAQNAELPGSAAEVVGKNVKDILPPELARRALENVHRALETNEPQRLEYARTFDNKTRHFEIHSRRYGVDSVVAILRNITKRREAEEQVRYQAALVENLLDAVISVDTDFCILSWNPAAEKIYGWSADEVMGKLIDDVVPCLWTDEEEAASKQALMEEGFWRGDVIQAHRDGHSLDIIGSTSLFRNEAGEITGAVSVNRDVTELRQAEAALRESEIRNSALIDAIPDSLARVDCDGVYLEVKLSQDLTWPFGEEEMIGKHLSDVLPAESAERALQQIQRVIQSGQTHETEYKLDTPKEQVCIEARYVKSGQNEVVVISRNVTERRRTEEQVRYQARLIENISEAIISVTLDLEIVSWNRAAETILGWQEEEVLGKSLYDIIPPDVKNGTKDEAIQQVAELGFWRGEITQPHRNGTPIHMLVSCNLIYNAEGEPTGAVSINRDITEQKRAEQALRASEARNRAILAAIPDSLAIVGRDGVYRSMTLQPDVDLGMRADDFVGRHIGEALYPKITEDAQQLIEEVLDYNVVRDVEFRLPNYKEEVYIEARMVKSSDDEVLIMARNVTERHKVEDQLRLQALLLENISDPVIFTDMNLDILEWNQAAQEVYGYDVDEALGKNVLALLNARFLEAETEQVISELLHNKRWRGNQIHRTRDGRELFISASASLVYDRNGKPIGALTVKRDVTEQRRAEEQLRFQAELLQNVSDAVVSADMEMRIVSWNPAAEKMYGWREEEVVGRLFREVLNLEVIGETRDQAVANLMRDGFWRGEQKQQRRDGSPLTILSSISTLRDNEGNPTGFLGANRDITERKEAEIALQESEARFRAMVQHASEAIVLYDMDSHSSIEVNDHAIELFGLSREELLKINGKTLSAEIQPNGGEREVEVAKLRQRLKEQGTSTFEWLYHINGQDILAEVRAVTMPDRNRWLVRHSIVDITERRRHEERIQQSQKLESLGLLAGGIAHDFNNLLTGILGQTSLAQHRLTVEHPARTNMERATAAGLRARTLIQQMLAYAGRGQADVQQVNLNDIIQESVQLFETSLPTTVLVETQLDEALPAVNADAGQMQQLVVNLVLNAADAITNAHASMETNGGRPANLSEESGRILLETTVRQVDASETNLYLSEETLLPGRYVMLHIRDNGYGMSPATLARVFDPFFSTKPEGTGLGLSVAVGIVKRHRGGLSVSSQLNRGTTFDILLPVAAEAPSVPQPTPVTQTSVTGTVLVIDDEVTLCQTVRDILESVEMTVLAAHDGHAGVEILRERNGKIDLVLLDMRMPGLDGTQTLELLREIAPALKVIISSGYSSGEQIARLDGAQEVEFLPKPYLADELIETVRRALGEANQPPLEADANHS